MHGMKIKKKTIQAIYKIPVLYVVVKSLHQNGHIRINKPSAIQAVNFLSLNLQRAILIKIDFFAGKKKIR
jgi:poly-beta-hydroxyalkanoate depolymerase